MAKDEEVFVNPTVKEVHFEIRFPNLFYIETKIGDFQVNIMDRFPEAKLIFKHQVLLAETGLGGKFQPPPDLSDSEAVSKIWSFKSGTGVEVNVRSNGLGILSRQHKTYNNPSSPDKFRDVIEFVVSNFINITSIPVIQRIGLRYIDECPIPQMDNRKFHEWYNSTFALDRFRLSDAREMTFLTTVKRDAYFLRFSEALTKKNETYILLLDFDGFAEEIKPMQYLEVTDNLHSLISEEYNLSIKDPVRVFMRQPKRGANERA
jgi:uncharacterized protein (TIGR04255 family)